MGRIIYSDGRTALTTTAFRYKLTDSAGTLVKDWTTGATWTEEPAGTYYLDDAAAVPGTRYAVEPATGEVGGAGMVPEPMRGTDGANTVAPDNATIAAIAADYAKTGEAATAVATLNDFDPATDVVARVTLVDTTTTNTDMRGTDDAMLAASYTTPDNTSIAAILVDTGTTIPAQIAATDAKVDTVDGILDAILPLIQRVYRYFFNKRTHTNSSVVVYADDGVTPDATMVVSGDTTTVTKDAPA